MPTKPPCFVLFCLDFRWYSHLCSWVYLHLLYTTPPFNIFTSLFPWLLLLPNQEIQKNSKSRIQETCKFEAQNSSQWMQMKPTLALIPRLKTPSLMKWDPTTWILGLGSLLLGRNNCYPDIIHHWNEVFFDSKKLWANLVCNSPEHHYLWNG